MPLAGTLADAAVLCHSADQVLYVVRYDFASRNQVVDAMHSVTGRGAELAGFVINGRPPPEGRKAANGYGYGRYGYGKYGYGSKYWLQQKAADREGAPRLGSLGQRLGDEDGAEEFIFSDFLRDAVTGVCSPEAMALAKTWTGLRRTRCWSWPGRTILSRFGPANSMRGRPHHLPGWRRRRRGLGTVEALVRQTMATQSLF